MTKRRYSVGGLLTLNALTVILLFAIVSPFLAPIAFMMANDRSWDIIAMVLVALGGMSCFSVLLLAYVWFFETLKTYIDREAERQAGK